jgi:RNA polymerase sigma-54 factor
VKKYLKKKMDSAEWLLAAIRQRQSTLQRIAQEIVDIQSEFLDHGIANLKPLKMADVAERVGVHVSTISRAISGKYMQTPRGIFEIKFFFTGGATKDDGNVEARGSVIQRIKQLIAEESKANPLSDIAIVNKLAESGLRISRRTVTKYREAESIPSSRERRSY